MSLDASVAIKLIAIDPGASGAAAIRHVQGVGHHPEVHKYEDVLSPRIAVRAALAGGAPNVVAVMEEVHASPVMSPSSAFSFGENFGTWLGVLMGLEVPTYLVSPQTWQKGLHIPPSSGKERKNHLKEAAQRRFPNLTVTLANADALLLLDWAAAEMRAGRKPGTLYDFS